MNLYKPKMYKKNIHEINYDLLKEKGITCIIFDLDNTLGLISNIHCPKETIQLIKKLKKDFLVLICSNNNKSRLKPYMNELGIDGVAWSLKPLVFGLMRIKRKYKLHKKEMCLVGDQIVTDVCCANKFGILSILVDPLGKKDLKITALNRIIENHIVKQHQKRNIFERGKYYE